MDLEEARRQLGNLKKTLEAVVDRDAEQEVQGMALPVLDAVISSIRELLPASAVVQAAREIISPETVELGEPVRAVDILLVVSQLEAAPPTPTIEVDDLGPRRSSHFGDLGNTQF